MLQILAQNEYWELINNIVHERAKDNILETCWMFVDFGLCQVQVQVQVVRGSNNLHFNEQWGDLVKCVR
jgi:hypothetical protein